MPFFVVFTITYFRRMDDVDNINFGQYFVYNERSVSLQAFGIHSQEHNIVLYYYIENLLNSRKIVAKNESLLTTRFIIIQKGNLPTQAFSESLRTGVGENFTVCEPPLEKPM